MVESDVYKHLSIRSIPVGATDGAGLCRLRHLVSADPRPRMATAPSPPLSGQADDWRSCSAAGRVASHRYDGDQMLDGTKTDLHAVVDNYTRRVLAWALKSKLTAETTRTILREAAGFISDSSGAVNVMTSENLVFDKLDDLGQVVAQIDVA